MIEILAYKTAEEAEQQLINYEDDNRKAFAEFKKPLAEGETRSARLERQKYFFVVELGALVDDGPDKYCAHSQNFPFVGFDDCYDDLRSLAQGIKSALAGQTPQNIEAILYTVEDHDTENKKIKEEAQENKMASIDLFQDGVYGMSNKNLEDVLELLRCLKALT